MRKRKGEECEEGRTSAWSGWRWGNGLQLRGRVKSMASRMSKFCDIPSKPAVWRTYLLHTTENETQ